MFKAGAVYRAHPGWAKLHGKSFADKGRSGFDALPILLPNIYICIIYNASYIYSKKIKELEGLSSGRGELYF